MTRPALRAPMLPAERAETSGGEITSISTGDDQLVKTRFIRMFPPPGITPAGAPPGLRGPKPADLFQTALQLADMDESHCQPMIKRFASDTGLGFIEELTHSVAHANTRLQKVELWTTQLCPFFEVLDKARAYSGPLESSFQGIFKSLTGTNCEQLGRICHLISDLIAGWQPSPGGVDLLDPPRALQVLSRILKQMCQSSALSSSSGSFRKSIIRLKSFLEHRESDAASSCSEDIQYVLDELDKKAEAAGTIAQRSAFGTAFPKSQRDGPGGLSPGGPRHDNDDIDITKVRILPTTKEILSSTPPYLPLYDPSSWHVDGIRGLLDRHFRLLREDNLGPVREVVKPYLQGVPSSMRAYQGNSTKSNEYKVHTFDVSYDKRDGLELHISVKQPPEVACRRTAVHREQWWVETNKLDWERLVCLIQNGNTMFCVVSRATCRTQAQLLESKDKSKKKRYHKYHPDKTLFVARDLAYLVLEPVEPKSPEFNFIFNARHTPADGISLVEFPSLLLASFKPTLASLQDMYTLGKIPMGEYLVGRHGNSWSQHEYVAPPLYASTHFEFDLGTLTGNRTSLSYWPRDEPNTKEVCGKTSLDEGQAEALLNALRRRLALCQGPPGTGKSYTGEAIIEVLLANKTKADLGPIICICQTNHALDQLLEHLYLRKNIRKIVRVGSQSKSTVIGELTLQNIMEAHPPLLNEQIVTRKRNKARQKAAVQVIEAISHLQTAGFHQREELIATIEELHWGFEHCARVVNDHWSKIKSRTLREFDIIGVTTSGLARFRNVLSKVMSKVVLCEEAGEVLECHTLSALMPHTEHLILIGDHQQLRPMTNNWDFQIANPEGRPWSYDLSLFERLVNPLLPSDQRLPFDTLDIQRRMHPVISSLIRSTLYPRLRDAENVRQYPALAGFRRRLFWFHHNKPEDAANADRSDQHSFSNRFEVEVVKTVLAHLSRQNVYADGEIAVLTPYAGQLRQLKISLGAMYDVSMNERDTEELERRHMMVRSGNSIGKKRIRVATVDNFQGEEASVVVVSLVRSNKAQKCGFLSQENRINVLFSRAKYGMILIGDAETYSPVDMWWDIIQMLQRDGNIGPSFEIPCPRHTNGTILASTTQHFLTGTCSEKCGKPLICGHLCAGKCHTRPVHDLFRCQTTCGSKFHCGHTCSQICHHGVLCGPCDHCKPSISSRKLQPTMRGTPNIGAPQSLTSNNALIQDPLSQPPSVTIESEGRLVSRTRSDDMKAMDVSKSIGTGKRVGSGILHVADGLAILNTSVSKPLVKFISTAHKRLVEFELRLLDEQESLQQSLDCIQSSDELTKLASRKGKLDIRGMPLIMIETVQKWLEGRYDPVIRLIERINRHCRETQQEERRFREIVDSDHKQEVQATSMPADAGSQIQFQASLSALVLLIRCSIVILSDYLSLRRKAENPLTVVSIDLTGFRRICDFLISTARGSSYPRHEAEAHILIGKMVTITQEVSATTPGSDRLQDPKNAEAHLDSALTIVLKHSCLGYLIEDIDAVAGEISTSAFGSIVSGEQKRSSWQSYAAEFQLDDYWHICANGHPFSVKNDEMTIVYCPECGAPSGDSKSQPEIDGKTDPRYEDDDDDEEG